MRPCSVEATTFETGPILCSPGRQLRIIVAAAIAIAVVAVEVVVVVVVVGGGCWWLLVVGCCWLLAAGCWLVNSLQDGAIHFLICGSIPCCNKELARSLCF